MLPNGVVIPSSSSFPIGVTTFADVLSAGRRSNGALMPGDARLLESR
jgi:hypothetical protein